MAEIKTLQARSVYKADHGGEKFLITAQSGGVDFQVHTWSPTIANVGFEGEVEKYEDKAGDQCLRLPKKEEWSNGSAHKPQKTYTRDDEAIKAQWAIGQAVAWCVANGLEASAIEAQAKDLFKMVDRVKNADTAGSETDDSAPIQEQFPPIDLSEIPF